PGSCDPSRGERAFPLAHPRLHAATPRPIGGCAGLAAWPGACLRPRTGSGRAEEGDGGSGAPTVTRPSSTHTVLVVEDQPELREVLCHVLTDASITAIGVEDGQAAVEHLRANPAPAAIVLDLLL